MNSNAPPDTTKKKALAGLAAALIVTVGAWFFIDNATDRGLARLDLIDRVAAVCNVSYASARTSGDTSRIDAQPLSALIDGGRKGAPRRCGDLRRAPDDAVSQDSARRAKAERSVMPTREGR